jgi:hypothetical protein
MSKVLKIAGVLVIAIGLVLGLTLPAVAASFGARPWAADDSQSDAVRGEVLSVGDQEFVIQSGEQELTIKVDEDTEYYQNCVPGRVVSLARQRVRLEQQHELSPLDLEDRPLLQRARLKLLRHFGEPAEFGDIAVGDMVTVWLAEGDKLAEAVLIVAPTNYASVSGTIEGVSSDAKTITLAPDVGGSITLNYDENTEFVLKGIIQVEAGQSARVLYDSDNMLAKTVVVYATGD